jgi:AraC family transcriptional regulator
MSPAMAPTMLSRTELAGRKTTDKRNSQSMVTGDVQQIPIAKELAIPGVEAFIVDYSAALKQNGHRHEHASITLVLRGEFEEVSSRQSQHATPLIAIAKAKGTAHTNIYGAKGCRALQVNFRREFEFAAADLSVLESGRYEGGRVVSALLRFLKGQESKSSSPLAGAALCEALAELSARAPAPRIVPKWLARVKDAIDCADSAAQPNLTALSGVAAVHPVYLTRQFKRHYGCTIREYIKKNRFHAAAHAVAEGNSPLGTIAHRFGYSDQAHFCRAFRSAAGLQARAYRHLIAGFLAIG